MHGLLYDPKALEKYPEFHDMVLEIVNGERNSAMKQKSIDRAKTYSHSPSMPMRPPFWEVSSLY